MEENNVEVLVSDSRLAFMQGKYDESLKLAKEALEQDANSADAHQCAGNAYMSKADYDTAIEHYKKAIENDADNGDRYFNLGYAYASGNYPVQALEMFAKADEVGCSPAVVGQLYKIMAMLCFDMNRYEDAILNFIKSEKIIGIDMDVLCGLAAQALSVGADVEGSAKAGAVEVRHGLKKFCGDAVHVHGSLLHLGLWSFLGSLCRCFFGSALQHPGCLSHGAGLSLASEYLCSHVCCGLSNTSFLFHSSLLPPWHCSPRSRFRRSGGT